MRGRYRIIPLPTVDRLHAAFMPVGCSLLITGSLLESTTFEMAETGWLQMQCKGYINVECRTAPNENDSDVLTKTASSSLGNILACPKNLESWSVVKCVVVAVLKQYKLYIDNLFVTGKLIAGFGRRRAEV